MKHRRIVISGDCLYEVIGLAMLLDAEGYDVSLRREVELKSEDVLLIALSAEPLLNWLSLLTEFFRTEDMHRGHTLILVPSLLRNIQKMFSRIQIIDGTLPVAELKKNIIEQIKVKRDVLVSRAYERLCLS
ncbi:hypothetical protein Q6P28_004660 [Salmonella enterica]|nr:hypothetical protein [Salmonella enterica]